MELLALLSALASAADITIKGINSIKDNKKNEIQSLEKIVSEFRSNLLEPFYDISLVDLLTVLSGSDKKAIDDIKKVHRGFYTFCKYINREDLYKKNPEVQDIADFLFNNKIFYKLSLINAYLTLDGDTDDTFLSLYNQLYMDLGKSVSTKKRIILHPSEDAPKSVVLSLVKELGLHISPVKALKKKENSEYPVSLPENSQVAEGQNLFCKIASIDTIQDIKGIIIWTLGDSVFYICKTESTKKYIYNINQIGTYKCKRGSGKLRDIILNRYITLFGEVNIRLVEIPEAKKRDLVKCFLNLFLKTPDKEPI